MRSELRHMELTTLDERALHYLHAVKVATYKQLQRDIYEGYHLRSVCNRIYRLEDNNLVQGASNRSIAKGVRIISLTNKGFKGFVATGCDERVELKSDSVEHDLALVDLRSQLLNLRKVGKYFTENQVQSWGREGFDFLVSDYVNLNSDGLLQIQMGQREILVPVEYERTQKSVSRYRDIVRKYYSHSATILIFFVATNPSILKQVKKQEKSILGDLKPKFLYSLHQDFTSDDALTLENVSGNRLVLSTS